MNFNISTLKSSDIYKIMSNFTIPRPIAWISTISNDGILNLAPFSYFTPLSSNPATFIVSIGHKSSGEPKDTLKNLRDTKKCSIIIASTNQTQELHNSANPLNYNESEFKKFNIPQTKISKDYPSIPKGSQMVYFCEYLKEVDLENSKTIPVILKLNEVFIDDYLIKDKDSLKFNQLDAIARVGAKYFKIGNEIKIL